MSRKPTETRRTGLAEILAFPLSQLSLFSAAPTPDGLPADTPDGDARERALDVRGSWVVEAPAGSGKTGLLIQRFLKLLADENVDAPEQVLAITFTVKATGEMSDRVMGQLQAAALGTAPGNEFDRQTRPLAEAVIARDRRAGWGLLEQPRRLNIRTIDAVCAEIAGSLPVLSGTGGRLAPALDASGLHKEAARRTLGQLGGADTRLSEAVAAVLQHRDGNLPYCERMIAEMLAWRDQWGSLVPIAEADLEDAALDRDVLPRLERTLQLAICQALTQLSQTICSSDLQALTEAAAELGHLDGYNGQPSPIAFCAGRNEPPGDRAEHLEHWRALVHLVMTPSAKGWRKGFAKNVLRFETEKSHKDRLAELVSRMGDREDLLDAMWGLKALPPARYPAEQWMITKALFRVLARALVELQLVFAERGECDFTELGLAARSALARDSGAEDLAAALGVRTRHLLVDEMQDTSTSQYDLICRLTRSWDGKSQTLFLVGDPKQSIYRFRHARVERFVRTLHEQRLGEVTVGALRLTANFRSQPRLVEQFNETFSRIFPAAVNLAHAEEVPYVEAAAMRPGGFGAGLAWHVEAVPYDAALETRARYRRRQVRDDANAVREIAMEWLGRPLPAGRTEPWRIAVLVRSRPHLTSIVAALKRDGGEGAVPFRAVEIEPLGERQEVLDLLALTRALLHPADRVAWFAILRAPWCGLTLADLHLLAGADDPALRECGVGDLIARRGHLISREGEQRLIRVWPVLEAAATRQGRWRLAEEIERTWRSLGGDAPLNAEARENADRFLRLVDELETAGRRLDLSVLAQRMERLYAEASVHAGAVDLMTIHGAKGLEWDVVMVPGLHRVAQADRNRLLNWVELDAAGEDTAHAMLAPVQGTGEDSTDLVKWIRSVHTGREIAERKRLLYVACTRAREELHLFAAPETTARGKTPPAPTSLLDTVWDVAEPYLQGPRVRSAWLEQEETFDLAAAADAGPQLVETPSSAPMLYRLPLSFDAVSRSGGLQDAADSPAFAMPYVRPEGSFAARAFGNAVHAFLELAADQIAAGADAEALRGEVSGWLPRAAAMLRGAGLAPAVVARGGQRVVNALAATLGSAEGRWILAAHPGAASEYALAAQPGSHAGLRLDRIFRAGASPMGAGSDYLWIIDYKTGTHATGGLEEFLGEQRALYRPQLDAYARTMAELMASGGGEPTGMRVGLFYPSLAELIWWIPPV